MKTGRIKTLDEARKEHILKVLRSTDGDLERAGRILGISVAVLRRRMKEYGISTPEREKERDS